MTYRLVMWTAVWLIAAAATWHTGHLANGAFLISAITLMGSTVKLTDLIQQKATRT